MRNKVKTLSVVLCVVVVLVCLISYSGAVSELYYDICNPSSCSIISGYETKVLETVPAGYQVSEYEPVYGMDDVKIVEITYELFNPVNDKIVFGSDLCYYYGENDEWISVVDMNLDYSDISQSENCKILPPGERVFFKDYVLVPKGMKEIYAYRGWGVNDYQEKVTIRL